VQAKDCSTAIEKLVATAESGDLLFLSLDCGRLGWAIQASNEERFQCALPQMNHVGFVEKDPKGQLWFIEAISGPGVIRTPVRDVLMRPQTAPFTLEKFRTPFRSLAVKALKRAKQHIGKTYDQCFRIDENEIYCSQLIYQSFADVNQGHAVFGSLPMRFGKPGSETRKFWEWYFRMRQASVPDGEPGTSPHSLWLQGKGYLFVGKTEREKQQALLRNESTHPTTVK